MISPKRLKSEDKEEVLNKLIEFYNLRSDDYGLMERDENVYKEYADFINKKINDKNKTILDFGTGSWRIVKCLEEIGLKNVFGLDYFSPEKMVLYNQHLKNFQAKLLTYSEPDIIPLSSESVDCVSSLCVVEHLTLIEKNFNEMDRVLKKNGLIIIVCPNWSGINVPINALIQNITKKDRLWFYDNPINSFFGIFRSIKWYFEALLTDNFIQVYPRIKNGKIDFERSDDDALHLCQPISIKKYFRKRGYEVVTYNRGYGTTKYSKIFNNLFPSMATTNTLVFRKR